MNKKNFIKILQQPEKLSKKELLFLQEISDEFPYFQVTLVNHQNGNDVEMGSVNPRKNSSNCRTIMPNIIFIIGLKI